MAYTTEQNMPSPDPTIVLYKYDPAGFAQAQQDYPDLPWPDLPIFNSVERL